MSILDMQTPPAPKDPIEAIRWEETRRRRRMLDGTWRNDLETRLQEHLGSVRRAAWGPISLAIMPFRNICRELAVLYDAAPEVMHPDEAGAQLVSDALKQMGMWGLMQRVQQYTLGCREYMVRLDIDPTGRLLARAVPPDVVTAHAMPGAPDQLGGVHERRVRTPPGGKPGWYVDILDVRDPSAPVYQITDVDGLDFSAVFGVSGWPDLWRNTAGTPIIPYILYHAQRTGDRLWEPYEGIELVESSLDFAVMYMMIVHTFRDASWPQRYAVDVEVAGAEIVDTGGGRRSEVVTDPSALLMMRRIEGAESQPMIGQWQPGGDVAMMEEVLSNMIARAAQDAGVPPSDVQRLGGTARSGVAISLTNEGKRAAQRRFSSTFREGDTKLVALAATLINRHTGAGLPESDYEVVYREIPLSPDELKARREHALAMVQAGLMSPAEAYRETHAGMSLEQAAREVAKLTGPVVAAAGDATVVTPTPTSTPTPTITLTSTDIAGIVTVDEARASQGLPPLGDADGGLTVTEYQAKHAAVTAAAANAVAGTVTTPSGGMTP